MKSNGADHSYNSARLLKHFRILMSKIYVYEDVIAFSECQAIVHQYLTTVYSKKVAGGTIVFKK